MVATNKHFENGKQYTLKELFSGNIKLIIPDLQRDYCWGTEGALVGDFTDSLIYLFGNHTEMNLGLVYGYEEPETHIQLCDGQQRITTLYLLIGLLNRKSGGAFKEHLLTNQKNDTRLQYAIRESTLYFLEDLTKRFFLLPNDGNAQNIKTEAWYFKDYDLDPSIQSMLSALNIMEEKITQIAGKAEEFGNFILSNLTFLYIDLENRKNGEETFVVINTTGEPLSPTENVKPLLITNQLPERQNESSEQWEEWEQFFWQNRGENDTADNGLKEFFRWITLLNLDRKNDNEKTEFEHIQEENADYSFSTILKIKFDDICEYFQIVKLLFSEERLFKDELALLSPDENGNKQIDWFKLLPVIAYCKKFYIRAFSRDLERVRHFFFNLAKIDNVSKAVGDLLARVIDIIGQLLDTDIASIRNIPGISTQILTEEEKTKFDLYTNPQYPREELENKFWKEEAHPIWNGEILPLIEWSKKNGQVDLDLFDLCAKTFSALFRDDLKLKELDITRKMLLTLDLAEYPKIFHGHTNYSFCYEPSDWQALIKENVAEFGKFITKLNAASDIYAEQKQMIENSEKEYEYNLEYFVKYPELLEYCTQKNVQWDDDLETWWLIPAKKATRYALLETYVLYLELKNKNSFDGNWTVWFYEFEKTCAVIEKETDKTAINLFYAGKNKYEFNLFNRNATLSKNKYESIAKEFALRWGGNRYVSGMMTKKELISMVKKIASKI